MPKTSTWLQAIRPRTLPLSLSGIILGTGAAFYNGFWDIRIFILALSTTILFQILSNLANDLGDGIKGTDNDARVGPQRAIQSGEISVRQMKSAVVLTSVMSLISSATLIFFGAQGMGTQMTWFYSGLALLCVLAAVTYTVGKKAYGYYGLGDLMVILFFGIVSVLGVYSLYAKSFSMDNVLLAIFVGMLSTSVLNLNNMRDYKNDAESGKNTLVVKMGPNNAKFYHSLLIVFALLSVSIYINNLNEPLLFICLSPALILLVHLRRVMKVTKTKDFDPELKIVALTTFGISLLLTIGLILLR